MDNLLTTLHEATPLTNADMFSILCLGFILGVFVSDGFNALVEFIVNKVKKKKDK